MLTYIFLLGSPSSQKGKYVMQIFDVARRFSWLGGFPNCGIDFRCGRVWYPPLQWFSFLVPLGVEQFRVTAY